MELAFLQHLAGKIKEVTSANWTLLSSPEAQSGGCINQSYVLKGAPCHYFLKLNQAAVEPMFIAEAESLTAIAKTSCIRTPTVICHGVWQEKSYLLLEHMKLNRHRSIGDTASSELGKQLANLHKNTSPHGQYGWAFDNFIGETPQPNKWMQSWPTFWQENRLKWQLKLAADKGIIFKGTDQLLNHIPDFFRNYTPVPSLLHGDLWGGNAGFDDEGKPVVYDPASYYGDRETDLAFTEIFGGFSAAFYEAYDVTWPREAQWQQRRDLYNLYHILNHHHLFGGHYAQSAQDMIHSLNRMF